MKDDFTTEFFDWLDFSDLKPIDVSNEIGGDPITVSGWRSRGIPKGKRYACEAFMKESLAGKASQMKAVIPLKITQEQFRDWNQAALSESLLIEDWAIQALDSLAAEEPLVSKLPATPLPLGEKSRQLMESLGELVNEAPATEPPATEDQQDPQDDPKSA